MSQNMEAIHAKGVALCFLFLRVTGDGDHVTLCRLVGGCAWFCSARGERLSKRQGLTLESLYFSFRDEGWSWIRRLRCCGLDRCEGEDALATAGGTPALRAHGREPDAEVPRCAQDDMFKGGFVEFARSWVLFCSREFRFG